MCVCVCYDTHWYTVWIVCLQLIERKCTLPEKLMLCKILYCSYKVESAKEPNDCTKDFTIWLVFCSFTLSTWYEQYNILHSINFKTYIFINLNIHKPIKCHYNRAILQLMGPKLAAWLIQMSSTRCMIDSISWLYIAARSVIIHKIYTFGRDLYRTYTISINFSN